MTPHVIDFRVAVSARIISRNSGLGRTEAERAYLLSQAYSDANDNRLFGGSAVDVTSDWLDGWFRCIADGDEVRPGIGIAKAEVYCTTELFLSSDFSELNDESLCMTVDDIYENARKLVAAIAAEVGNHG